MDFPYIFIVLILLVLSFIEHKKTNSKAYWFAEMLVVFFIGLRDPTVGADTLNYVRFFTGVQNFYNYDSRDLEVLFPVYNKMFGVIFFHDGTLYLLFNAIVTFSPILYLVNHYSKNKCLSITLFFIGMFYTTYFVALRQMLGLSLLLWGVIAVLNNIKYKWIIYGISTCVGFCFHESVVLFSLSYLLAYIVDLKKKYWITIVVVAFISRFIVANIDFSGLSELYALPQISFMERTSIYLDNFVKAEDSLNLFSVIINFATVLVVVYLLDESNIKHWFSKIYLLGYCLDCLLSFWPFVHRAEVALTIFFIIVFTWVFRVNCKLFIHVMRSSVVIFLLLTYLKRNIVYDKDGLDRMHPYSITKFD